MNGEIHKRVDEKIFQVYLDALSVYLGHEDLIIKFYEQNGIHMLASLAKHFDTTISVMSIALIEHLSLRKPDARLVKVLDVYFQL